MPYLQSSVGLCLGGRAAAALSKTLGRRRSADTGEAAALGDDFDLPPLQPMQPWSGDVSGDVSGETFRRLDI